MSPYAIAAVATADAMPSHGSQRIPSWHMRHIVTGATKGKRLIRMKRGAVSGPSHHVDNPVLRELTQTAMNDAITNNHVNNKNRPQAIVNWPARLGGGEPNVKGDAVGGGGGGEGMANGEAEAGFGGVEVVVGSIPE